MKILTEDEIEIYHQKACTKLEEMEIATLISNLKIARKALRILFRETPALSNGGMSIDELLTMAKEDLEAGK